MAAAGPGDWYAGLPPVTRTLGTGIVLSSVAMQLGLIYPGALVLLWPEVLWSLQLWRLVTNFLFLGGFSFAFLMQLLMLHNYGVALENTVFLNRQADFLWMLLFGAGIFLLSSLALNLQYYSTALIFMLCYVWSRHNPEAQVSIMGFFRVPGFYLPWAWCLMTVIMGGSPMMDLAGIFVGHTYYFFSTLYPRRTGKDPLRTPGFVHSLCAWAGFGQAVGGRTGPAAGGGGGFLRRGGAFQGRGQRLGGN